MRLLEIVIPLLLGLYLLWRHPRPLIVRLVPSAAMIVTLAHFTLERYRWQMIPIYVLTLLLDFFEMTLNNKPSLLFDGTFNDCSEVEVRQQ